MKSIRTKFIAFVLTCLIASCTVIGGAGILTSREVVNQDSSQIMNLLCLKEAQTINAQLSKIEQSVRTLAVYTIQRLDTPRGLRRDAASIEAFSSSMESIAINAAQNTEGALAVYIRFNPDIYPPTSGLFFSKNSASQFERIAPTDISLFSSDDMEHVGWYYIPMKNKTPTWLAPYLNKNTNAWLISYVIPIYIEGVPVGIVGMDISFPVLTSTIDQIKVYNNGYAFLVDGDARIVYHRDLKKDSALAVNPDDEMSGLVARLLDKGGQQGLFAYTFHGVPKKMTFQNLRNGLKLVLTAPAAEIDAKAHSLLMQIGVFSCLILLLSCLITFAAATRFVKPLRELNIAAKKIADGDLSISITHKAKDEIGELADSFRQTAQHLQKYISYINGLAYRDALTGCKNKTAYIEATTRLDEQIHLSRPSFGVVVFDLNNLKILNDTCGHDLGDMLIISAAKIICHTFKRSPIYRIGGDEFAAILENSDLDNYMELLLQFTDAMEEWNSHPENKINLSVARGLAIYDEDRDLAFQDVFKRADDAMYQNKAKMKQREARAHQG